MIRSGGISPCCWGGGVVSQVILFSFSQAWVNIQMSIICLVLQVISIILSCIFSKVSQPFDRSHF